MPTVNQIIRKGRGNKKKKSKSPALLVGVNTIERRQTIKHLHKKEEYVPELEQ